jgi:hypothetical protein
MAQKPSGAGTAAPDHTLWPDALPKGLWPRLLLAQAHGGSVAKGGRNTHQNYDYVRAEDVIRDASRVLARAGLVAVTDGYELELREGKTKNGTRSLEVTARGTLRIVDPDSGDEAHFPIIGTGTDSPGDKAIYKAITGGLKYAWQAALTLAFGDDPEDSSTGPQADVQAGGDPAFGPPLKDVDKAVIRDAAALLLTVEGPSPIAAGEVLAELAAELGYMPKVVGDVVYRLAQKLREIDPSLSEEKAESDEARADADRAHAAAEDGDPAPDDLPPVDPAADPTNQEESHE